METRKNCRKNENEIEKNLLTIFFSALFEFCSGILTVFIALFKLFCKYPHKYQKFYHKLFSARRSGELPGFGVRSTRENINII